MRDLTRAIFLSAIMAGALSFAYVQERAPEPCSSKIYFVGLR